MLEILHRCFYVTTNLTNLNLLPINYSKKQIINNYQITMTLHILCWKKTVFLLHRFCSTINRIHLIMFLNRVNIVIFEVTITNL